MDPLPLVPENFSNHDVTFTLRGAFQNTLNGYTYPHDIARNILRNDVDDELKLKKNASQVLRCTIPDLPLRKYTITSTNTNTFLELCLDNDLNFRNHIEVLSKKLSSGCYALRVVSNELVMTTAKIVYHALMGNSPPDENQIYANTRGTVQTIQNAGNDIMVQKGLYLMRKDEMRMNFELKERLKLKRCDLFRTLKKAFVDEFCLIQAKDLLPDIVRQYLDFRYYKSISHICGECSRKEKSEKISQNKQKKPVTITEDTEMKTEQKIRNILEVIPKKITFHYYELGQLYTKRVRIINTSTVIQSVALKKHPISSGFSINLDQHSKLAPGMSVSAEIIFRPEVFRNYDDEVIFKNSRGDTFILPLNCYRDTPRLISYVLKSNANLLEQSHPGNTNFLEGRRKALNSTIDCGSCLVSQYSLVSIIVENKGLFGKFFLITEDEWFLQDIRTVSNCMELLVGDFWMYPTFFETNTDEMIVMNIIFQPTKPGLHVETLYLMCDNNSYEKLEIIGDALEFSRSFIKVDVLPRDMNISEIEDYCIYFGNTDNNTTKTFTLTVHNKSSLYLDCLWKFRNKSYVGVYDMHENWVTQKNENRSLIPYSTADFNFDISMNATTSGYHSIFISLLILNIPLASLSEHEKFILIESSDISGKTLSEAADIQITEFEIACFIDFPAEIDEQRIVCENCHCVPHPPKLVFSTLFLNFGIIPTGLKLQKELFVQSITDEHLNWIIIEVKYNIDTSPHSEVLRRENLSCSSGKFLNHSQRTDLTYSVHSKTPISWVSILVLISIKDEETSRIESICVVTYEVIDYDIVINTGHATAPILCPLNLIYVGIPINLTFTIENRSPITGCFYFMKPNGRDSDNISIKLTPNSSVIKAFETMEISVKLRCSEIGIFDNLFVPCFIGKGQEPIMLRVLCAVDGVHVAFFLPDNSNRFRRFIWPPKVVYEYDDDWGYCTCEKEDCLEYSNSFDRSSKMTENLSETCFGDATEQKSSSGTLDSDMNTKRLEMILRDQFKEEVFLNEEIVEIHDLPIGTLKKLTIYIENITPIVTNYDIQSQNFSGVNDSEISMMKFKLRKNDAFWNDFVSQEYGILVRPESANGPLAAFDSVAINIWIYANTYGIYSEEIVIDIPEVPALSFSLLIEVVGSPIVFPMALNCITKNPIIRFGSFSYSTQQIKRRITISNTSCVPLHIVWHTFTSTAPDCDDNNKINVCFDVLDHSTTMDNITVLNEHIGENTNETFGIESKEIDMEPNSNSFIELFLNPQKLIGKRQKMDFNCHVIGYIYLKDRYMSKINYFFRKTGSEGNHIKIEATTTLEYPILQQDMVHGETKLILYANDVIFKKIYVHYVRLVFRNNNQSTCGAVLTTVEPFSLKNSKNEMVKEQKIVLKCNGCEEVIVNCFVDYEKILGLSTLVYDVPENEDDRSEKYAAIPFQSKTSFFNTEVYCADKENKVLHIRKNLQMQYDHYKEEIPINMYIYFPNIMVKPPIVKYDSVLLNTTRKTVISVYNLTGCAVKFEIYKSSSAQAFFVTPHFGEIPSSTGVNKQFVDIFVYFTPRECKVYHESIRIVTNIPNYFIEVPVKGTGTINEKFYVNYKI